MAPQYIYRLGLKNHNAVSKNRMGKDTDHLVLDISTWKLTLKVAEEQHGIVRALGG